MELLTEQHDRRTKRPVEILFKTDDKIDNNMMMMNFDRFQCTTISALTQFMARILIERRGSFWSVIPGFS